MKSKDRSKLSFFPFFYSRIHSRIFSSLNHKIRELMPPKRENSPNLYYYIYIVTPFCLASLNMLKDIYSGKGNMVTRLYSGINIITVNPIPVWKITHLLSCLTIHTVKKRMKIHLDRANEKNWFQAQKHTQPN